MKKQFQARLAKNIEKILTPRIGETAACHRSRRVLSTSLRKIDENDARRIADRRVMAGEVEAPGLAVHAEHGDVVPALIATIEELAGGVDVETARVVPACPFFPDMGQGAVGSDGKDPDAVVQPVARIDKPALGGNQDLGAEITSGKP